MFEGLSLTHILLFLVILLLLFGAKRLPEIGGALGKSIGEFKKSMRDIQTDMSQPPPAPPAPPAPKTMPPPTDGRAN
jgi:sec-independent protein translocase protein TatA